MPKVDLTGGYGDYEGEQGRRYAKDHAEARPSELAWLTRVAAEEGGPICELACGHGRLCLPLARQGHRVVGLDRSRTLIQIAEDIATRELTQVRSRLRFVIGDLRDFDLAETFQYVFIFFGGFFMLPEMSYRQATLACIHEHLNEGGLLEIEDPNPGGAVVSRAEMDSLIIQAGFRLEAALAAHELPLRHVPGTEPALLYRLRKT